MCRKRCCVIVWLLLSSNGALAAVGDDVEKAPDGPRAIEARVLAISDVVLQNHIDPPTRQQMILAGVKALYRADKRPVPKGLSGRVSELVDSEQILDYLAGIRMEFGKLEDLEAIMTAGMLGTLPGGGTLIDADTDKVQGQLAANRYVGVGIKLSMSKEDTLPAIPEVIYNGPAWRAGVQADDLILEIDGDATANKDLKQVVQELRGEDGSDVELVVRQPDSQESRRLTMTRGRVFIPTVEGFREEQEGQWRYAIDSAKDIALLRINTIGPSTLHELRQAAANLRRQEIRGIILDLRSGGGRLHDIIMVADSLLDGGVIGHIRSWDGVRKHEARPGALFQDLPLAVLVARHTSSGNVFLTAALQDHERAIVVGEPTSGQSYVRSIIPIPGRSEKIIMAVGTMQRPDGTLLLARRSPSPLVANVPISKPTDKKKRPGFIMPDHLVSFGVGVEHQGEQLGEDPMLAKAIEVLRDAAAEVPPSPRRKKNSGEQEKVSG